MTVVRKGAARTADILQALSRGEMQGATPVECLALNQAQLMRAVFPDLSPEVLKDIDAACGLGILKRMHRIGALLLNALGPDGIEICRLHRADTVRGWTCFMIDAQPDLPLSTRLTAIRPLADNAHFGVREWVWMAPRPHLIQDLDVAVAHLTQWTASPSERLRRFASEALRPRGVWCPHIVAFKHEPDRALPILTPLNADPALYVQDSVANWLNDAAKDQPDWIRGLCVQWLHAEAADATRHICRRALRNLDQRNLCAFYRLSVGFYKPNASWQALSRPAVSALFWGAISDHSRRRCLRKVSHLLWQSIHSLQKISRHQSAFGRTKYVGEGRRHHMRSSNACGV